MKYPKYEKYDHAFKERQVQEARREGRRGKKNEREGYLRAAMSWR